MAAARIYTVVFAVVVLWILLTPGPFFGPSRAWYERLITPGAGLALLLIGWAWRLRIRRGIERP